MNIVEGCLINAAKEGHISAIGHQCNCMGKMGAGVAMTIKNEFPEAYQAYISDSRMLGYYSMYDYDNLKVFNLYGQQRYGRDKRHTNYISLTLSLIRSIGNHNLKNLALPYGIGCGNAGGSWFVVEDLLIDIEKITGCNITLYRLGG
jgi:O-acetyl-ADP-ribose deacetylase (regulator of RNase III)